MHYELVITNADVASPLEFHSQQGAHEAIPAPGPPSIAPKKNAIIRLRLKTQPVTPATPGSLNSAVLYYVRDDVGGKTFYKFQVQRITNRLDVSRAPAIDLTDADSNAHNYQHYKSTVIFSKLGNRIVHLGAIRMLLTV